ncbi:sulfite exporter TauE/SafE family protein [Rubripirellula sp.]|nr:sulfite exporter TauE/SafE family protein [Rubripirellula sp.]
MGDDLGLLMITVVVISLLSGIIHSAIGFGFGIVAITLLPMLMDAKSAHVIVSISSVPMLMMATWTYRKGMESKTLGIAVVGAMIALPAGLYLFEQLSHELLIRLTGLGVLLMVGFSPLHKKRKQTDSDKMLRIHTYCLGAGAISGFLAGAVSIAGPPIAAFALHQGWSLNRYKAFVTQFLLVIAAWKAGLLVIRNHVDQVIAVEVTFASVFAMIGVLIGEKLVRNVDNARLKKIVAIVLIVVASFMLLGGAE